MGELLLLTIKMIPHRDPRLFSEFLIKGYRMTTIEDAQNKDKVLYAKLCLGILITLLDDLADNSALRNPELLKSLYKLNFTEQYKGTDSTLQFADHVIREMYSVLSKLPNFQALKPILDFDLRHIYLANQYAELQSDFKSLNNMTESKYFGPYNMGMVAAGMMDLMACPGFNISELGMVREIFVKAQRLGRIANVLCTLEREISEGDKTNEILISGCPEKHRKEIIAEFYEGLISLIDSGVKSISLDSYIDGVESLFFLHKKMKGII